MKSLEELEAAVNEAEAKWLNIGNVYINADKEVDAAKLERSRVGVIWEKSISELMEAQKTYAEALKQAK